MTAAGSAERFDLAVVARAVLRAAGADLAIASVADLVGALERAIER